jgi:signal peptidase II
MRVARFSSRMFVLMACLATIGCDRITKHAAATLLTGTADRSFLGDTIRLSYAENSGGFLSVGADLPLDGRLIVFTVGTGLLLAALALAAVRFRWQGARLLGAALVIAGGASNWIDRLATGAVIDFMNVGIGPLRTGIFNVADVAIMGGVVLIAVAQGGRTDHRGDAVAPR